MLLFWFPLFVAHFVIPVQPQLSLTFSKDTQLPDPPNVKITNIGFGSVSGLLTKVVNASIYLVTISCDSGRNVQYNGSDVTFTVGDLASSDVCVISAQAEVKFDDTKVNLTNVGPSIKFTTVSHVNANVTAISINEAWVTIIPVSRALKYNITVKQYDDSFAKLKHSISLSPANQENQQQIRYLLQNLEADIRYRVSVTVETEPTNENPITSDTFVYDFMTDEDECRNLLHSCDEDAVCINTFRSYHCICLEGFTGSGTSCRDIDECLESHRCEESQQLCINTPGSYECVRRDGFAADGLNCSDFDECSSKPCVSQPSCFNTSTTHTCTCNVGYTRNDYKCKNVGECTVGTYQCDNDNLFCLSRSGPHYWSAGSPASQLSSSLVIANLLLCCLVVSLFSIHTNHT